MRAAYDFDPLEPEGVEGRKCSHSNLPQMPQLEMMLPQPQIAPPLSLLRQSVPIVIDRMTGGDDPAALVLVVDDHEDSRVIMRLVAESVGLRVADARTGPEVLHAARTRVPARNAGLPPGKLLSSPHGYCAG